MEPEWMDQPSLDEASHFSALASLGRLNVLSNSVGIAYAPIRQLSRSEDRPLRILDIASGGGDVAMGIARRAARDKVPAQIFGCDMSERAVTFSNDAARRKCLPVEFFRHDVVSDGVPGGFDVVLNSLFLHHLTWDCAVAMLHDARRQASSLVVVQDLARCPAGYWLTQFARNVLTRSPVVYNDAIASVRAAFSLQEVRSLLDDPALADAQLSYHWPCRFRLVWRKPSHELS